MNSNRVENEFERLNTKTVVLKRRELSSKCHHLHHHCHPPHHHQHHHHHHHNDVISVVIVIIVIISTSTPAQTIDFTAADISIFFVAVLSFIAVIHCSSTNALLETRTLSSCRDVCSSNNVLRVTRALSSCGHSLKFHQRVACDPNTIKLP